MRKSDNGLPSYAQQTIFGLFAPNQQTKFQSACQTKFSKKKPLTSVDNKTAIKMMGCLWKSPKWFPNYYQKTILDPFAPNIQTRFQFPCETYFWEKNCQVMIIKFWITRRVNYENLKSGCQVMPKKPFFASLSQIYLLDTSPHTSPSPLQLAKPLKTTYRSAFQLAPMNNVSICPSSYQKTRWSTF